MCSCSPTHSTPVVPDMKNSVPEVLDELFFLLFSFLFSCFLPVVQQMLMDIERLVSFMFFKQSINFVHLALQTAPMISQIRQQFSLCQGPICCSISKNFTKQPVIHYYMECRTFKMTRTEHPKLGHTHSQHYNGYTLFYRLGNTQTHAHNVFN